MARWYAVDGAPLPLGTQWIEAEQAFNFALYSRHATGVTLLLFDGADLATPSRRIPLDYVRQKTGRMWHARVPRGDVGTAAYYGYSVDGASAPEQGDRFDRRKV